MTAALKLLCFFLVTSLTECQESETASDVSSNKNDLNQDFEYYDDYDTAIDSVSIKSDTKVIDIDNEKVVDLENKEKFAIIDEDLGDQYYNISTTDSNDETTTPNNDDRGESLSDTVQNVTLDALRVITIQSPGYPRPYENNITLMWNFISGVGSGLEINVTDVAMDIEADDHLTIIFGGEPDNPQNIIFSGYLNDPAQYHILDYDFFSVEFVSNPKSSENVAFTGFQLSAKHIGITVDSEAQTINPAPLWVEEPLENITIHLSGKSPSEFIKVSVEFKAILQDMVFFYIDSNNITVSENLTDEIGVKYDLIIACNVDWPDTVNCISLTFSAPVFFNATSGEYELSTENLSKMWSTFSLLEEYTQKFRSLGLEVYHFPNDSAVLTLWIATSLGVIVGLLFLMYVVWRFNCFDEYVRMSRFNDTESQVSKKSDASMYPTPHQTIPPLFGTESYDWMDDSTPPNYDDSYIATESGAVSGRRYDNKSFAGNDNMFFELDSDEEIVMSLPDSLTSKEGGSRTPHESTL